MLVKRQPSSNGTAAGFVERSILRLGQINRPPRRSAAVAFTYRLTPWRPALSLTLWADRSNVGAFQL